MSDEIDTEVTQLFEGARKEGLSVIETAHDLHALGEAKVRVLGRKSALSSARSGLRGAPEEKRRSLGQLANAVQTELEAAVAAKQRGFEASERAARWDREAIDVTLPGDAPSLGSLHPLTQTVWEIVDIFIGLGFKVAEGPEVELAKYNFDALNTPAHHPARSPQDTFYIKEGEEEFVLRTQTSPMQIRVMESQEPPVYVVVPGRCYRRDVQDATHLSGFTQIEGLAVDEGITMGDLKGSLQLVAREIFGRDLDVRLRPHHFDFTEPSAELDVQCFACRGSGCRICKQEGWIEVLGCGMVHPYLLEWVGYDTHRYSGFAFGMGPERIAALAHGVADIRMFYENDLRFLNQFGGIR
ncbi:MAG: phenylalanine--tRNA ligase subunit alpha [Actinobacteria bacterium]|nr:phenylalanine--tRNA ligase subunit alpha [Actinomycetota bacterium]